MRGLAIAVTLAALVTSVATPALCQSQRVALVAGHHQDTTVRRFEAELTVLGFTPIVVEGTAGDISLVADRAQAMVVLVLSERSPAVEVWVRGPEPGQFIRIETVTAPHGFGSESVLAIRTAELLRAAALEVEQRQPQPPPQPVEETEPEPELPTPQINAPLPPPRWPHRALRVRAGMALQHAPGGMGPAAQIDLEVSYLFYRWLGAEVIGLAPVHPAVVTGQEGEAHIWLGLVGGGLRASFNPRDGRIGGGVGLGVAAAMFDMRGRAEEPYQSVQDRVTAAAIYIRPRVSVRISPSIALCLDGTVGVALPRPTVVFAGRTVASWGRPLLSVGLSVMGMFL